MLYDFSTWYLSVVPVLVAIGISLLGNSRLNGTVAALDGKIRWQRDLMVVRSAINTNKQLAWLYLAVWATLVIALILRFSAGRISLPAVAGHIFAFGILTAPASLWTKSVEKKFKNMVVESEDPLVAETYRRYLAAWPRPSLSIPE